jgi:hypothetical protein
LSDQSSEHFIPRKILLEPLSLPSLSLRRVADDGS